ncbi:probable G-protein coupled receptor 139 [Aplysia californica]|uniref:Probable G-protein coupled receptor 139 n=1 Tax=Aplysia californica TaxID=6500 RepID=A0ABM0JGE9_APLCA|nr:probable G-protein coupled receptor 139 [Aplysia californica]
MSDGSLEKAVSKYLWMTVSPVLLVVGTVGNVLSIIVMSRRNLRGSQASVYLIALSLTDIVVLYTGLLRHFLRSVASLDVRAMTELGCKINIMMVYASLDISVWILVAFTFERFLSVFTPHKVKSYCTRLTSVIVICIIIILLLGLNSHFLFGFEFVVFGKNANFSGITVCYYATDEYRLFAQSAWPWIDFSVFSLVPFIIFIIGNVCIATRVVKSRRTTQRIGTLETNAAINSTANGGTENEPRTVSRIRHTAPAFPVPHAKRVDRTASMTAILLVLNIMFLITTTPVSIFFIVEPYWVKWAKTPREKEIIHLTFTIVNLIMYLNNAINFILYCLTGSRFRRELHNMLSKKRLMRVFPVLQENEHACGGQNNAHMGVGNTESTEVGGALQPSRRSNALLTPSPKHDVTTKTAETQDTPC